jgi:hypothetical protein
MILCCGPVVCLSLSMQLAGPVEIKWADGRNCCHASAWHWHVSEERLGLAIEAYSHVYTVVPRCDLYRWWGRQSKELISNISHSALCFIR